MTLVCYFYPFTGKILKLTFADSVEIKKQERVNLNKNHL